MWVAANPHHLHEESHLNQKGTECSVTRIIGPVSFHMAVKTDVYLGIFQDILKQLDDPELTLVIFTRLRQRVTRLTAL
jgi:hypothetical protein